MKYDLPHKCDGCDENKKTALFKELDPRHRKIDHYLCKKCANTTKSTKKILSRNTKLYGYGDPFGLKDGYRKFVIIGEK